MYELIISYRKKRRRTHLEKYCDMVRPWVALCICTVAMFLALRLLKS
jgi:hypothetical protein